MLDFGMMTIYLIALTIITAAGLLLVFLSVDLKLVYSGMKNGIKASFYRVSNMINDIENSRLSKLVNITETRIQKSNIRMYMPFYNGLIHFIICSITAMILFNWIKGYTNAIVSVVFSVVGLYMPYAMLQMFEDLMNNKVKKHVVDFLAILKNFLVATGDVFQAFDKGKEYFIAPLKSHVGIMVYEYRHKISAVKCINNLIEKLQHREFKLFFENLKICYTHGGDIVGLIDEYINERRVSKSDVFS